MSTVDREYDVIVVGAGIAGPGLAMGFARAGRKVLVLERDLSEPDRIVGELLQPGGCKALAQLGLASALQDIDSVWMDGYKIINKGQPYDIPYPKGERGATFHHGRFVGNMRQILAKTKGITLIEATVKDIVKNPYTGTVLGVKTVSKDNGVRHYFAKLTCVADGISSKFRRDFSAKTAVVRSYFAGLILEDADIPFPHRGHVFVGNHQPILVYQIGSRDTRILCDLAVPAPSNGNGDLKRHLLTEVMPNLPKQLHPSLEKALETQRIRVMPAQYLSTGRNNTKGLVMTGDALNMRHPLTGGGMTVAFKDALLLTDLLSPDIVPDLGDHVLVQRQKDAFFAQRKRTTTTINILAMALYSLFAPRNSQQLEILQRGCLAYLALGGRYLAGPVGLLSGLVPDFWMLFGHFFSVAFYSGYLMALDRGFLALPSSMLLFVSVIWTATTVFLPIMVDETRS